MIMIIRKKRSGGNHGTKPLRKRVTAQRIIWLKAWDFLRALAKLVVSGVGVKENGGFVSAHLGHSCTNHP